MPPTKKKKNHPYEARDDGLYYAETPLTNFTALVTDEVSYDDGEHQERMFRMVAKINGKSRTFDVPYHDFENLSWVSKHLGFGARLPLSWKTRKLVPDAIQLLSFDASYGQKEIFTHSGWHLHNDQWVYLFEGGGIGPEGLVDVSVSLPGKKLPYFRLPAPTDDPRDAIWESFCLIDLADWTIMLPLLAAVYRAPLGPSDYSVFVNGRTGSFKSELTALCQQHYGQDFTRLNLPESWSSTAYSLMHYAFYIKDGIFTVDDFKPTALSYQKLQKDADDLLRSQGNASGRSRLTSDGKPQKNYCYPRGVILSSGEDIPEGESLRSRLLSVTVPPNAISPDTLTEYQRVACNGVYAEAMAAYVQWLSHDYDETLANLERRIMDVRDELPNRDWHKRTATNISNALVGLGSLLDFMVDYRVLSRSDADNYYHDFQECFLDIGTQNQTTLKGEDECERFIESIRSALDTNECYLGTMNNAKPTDSSGPLVGWSDDEHIYLEPTKAFEIAVAKSRRQGSPLCVGKNTLMDRLVTGGYATTTSRRNTVIKWIGGKQKRVLSIRRELLEGER